MERKENGMNWFDKKFYGEFGIPQIWPLPQFSTRKLPKEIGKFINSKINLLLISNNHYSWCVKLLRLKFLGNLGITIKWLTQSEIHPYFEIDVDLVSIVNLHEEQKNGVLGSFVNKLISNQSQIIIGISETSILEQAFPYDLDTIENTFEVLKI